MIVLNSISNQILSIIGYFISNPLFYIITESSLYLTNLVTNSKENGQIDIDGLISKKRKSLSKLENIKKVLKNKIRSNIVLFLLENNIIYVNLIHKLFPRNYGSIYYIINDLKKDGIIREVGKKEYRKDKTIFSRHLLRNQGFSLYHMGMIKWYCLSEDYKEFFSKFESELKEKSDYGIIKNYKSKLNLSHKKIKEKSKLGKIKLRKIIKDLSKQTDNRDFDYKIKNICDKVLPQYGIYLEPKELKKKILNNVREEEVS